MTATKLNFFSMPPMSSLTDRREAERHLEQLLEGKRLTPAHRRVVQTLVKHTGEIGFMSSIELAKLANVSQPSLSRFSTALGFDGFIEMRNYFRTLAQQGSGTDAAKPQFENKYTAAIMAEAANVAALAAAFSDVNEIESAGKALAESTPLLVLGLRASKGLAMQFGYFASKIHPSVKTLVSGGSELEDEIEQAQMAGAKTLLAFVLPLYPQETIKALKHARHLGLKVIVVADAGFGYKGEAADITLTIHVNSSLVFDSSAASNVMLTVLLDAMCDALPDAEGRLESRDQSSRTRKVFVR